MDLSKLVRDDLEELIDEMLVDLSRTEEHLYQKYKDIIEDAMYGIDEAEAVEIVKSFKPYGEIFTITKVKDILAKMGKSDDEYVDYYLCMNMFYNDYKRYVDMKRLDVQDFCYELSKMFICDEDAPKHKVSKFFNMYIDHGTIPI